MPNFVHQPKASRAKFREGFSVIGSARLGRIGESTDRANYIGKGRFSAEGSTVTTT
jgi:hypothetical protein